MPKPNTNWPNPISESLQNHLLGMGATQPGFDRCGGGLLVSILEGGRRRLVAGVVGDEGVKAVDRHFLRGHHHPADRRGILRGGAASSPARARARRGRRPPRESGGGGRRLEGRGSERCVCFFSLKYPSAWGFCPCGVVLFNGRFCPLQGSSPTRLQQRANVLVLTNRDMILKLHFVKFKSFCTVLDLEHIIYRISFSLIHGSCFY